MNGKEIVINVEKDTMYDNCLDNSCIGMYVFGNNKCSMEVFFYLTFQTCNRTEKHLVEKTCYDVEGFEVHTKK